MINSYYYEIQHNVINGQSKIGGYFRKDNNDDLYLCQFDSRFPNGYFVSSIKLGEVYKGKKWNDSYNSIIAGTTIEYTIQNEWSVEDIRQTANVLGVQFNNVIKVVNNSYISVLNSNNKTLVGYTLSYYADGIGIIKTTEYDASNNKLSEKSLKSYKI